GRYIPAVHEGSAVLMAQGWARVAGKVGVAAVTHGPGLTNTITALVEGVKAGTPMVLLVGDTPVIDREHAQNIDQRALVGQPARASRTCAARKPSPRIWRVRFIEPIPSTDPSCSTCRWSSSGKKS